MQKWLAGQVGKMPDADVCLAMIGPDYFKSGPCKEELYKTAREGIPIIPIIFETPPPLKRGFFGESDEERERGNYVSARELAADAGRACSRATSGRTLRRCSRS